MESHASLWSSTARKAYRWTPLVRAPRMSGDRKPCLCSASKRNQPTKKLVTETGAAAERKITQAHLGDQGELWFAAALPQGWIWQPPRRDFGKDGLIVIRDGSELHNLELSAQIKTSAKPRIRDGHVVLTGGVSRSSIQYWFASPLPTLVVAVDISSRNAWYGWHLGLWAADGLGVGVSLEGCVSDHRESRSSQPRRTLGRRAPCRFFSFSGSRAGAGFGQGAGSACSGHRPEDATQLPTISDIKTPNSGPSAPTLEELCKRHRRVPIRDRTP